MIKVTVGDPVSLDCKVTGSPELRVRWMKDGRELQSIRQHKLSFENNISSLKMLSAQREDAGEYVFQVSNHISSCTCRVTVIVLGWCSNTQRMRHEIKANPVFSFLRPRPSNPTQLHQTPGRHAAHPGLLCSDVL